MAWWNELPVVGGLAGSIFGNPEADAHQRALQQARQDMLRYRPDAMNARMNVMGQMQHAFTPMNNMMAQAYGPQSQIDMSKIIQNPFPKQMQEGMMQQAFTPQLSPEMQKDLSKAPKAIQDKVKARLDKESATQRQKAGY